MMETQTMTISELAEGVASEFKRKTRADGSKYWCREYAESDWIVEMCHAAHGDKLPDDWCYEFIVNALDAIANADTDDEEIAREALYSIEPDAYTSDLTAWLHSRCDRVYYLTEVLEEFGMTDGFAALSAAQSKEQQEVAESVLQSLIEHLEA